ncbi:unnamed protein product [Aphis gossypii]|uniref:Uncharacterized protein n=1 Tax=Aphis gossypii TaxID=80765 RepID=A0A9P0J327_APHGO|nr:unnamed protein product [Aphis gossypii]
MYSSARARLSYIRFLLQYTPRAQHKATRLLDHMRIHYAIYNIIYVYYYVYIIYIYMCTYAIRTSSLLVYVLLFFNFFFLSRSPNFVHFQPPSATAGQHLTRSVIILYSSTTTLVMYTWSRSGYCLWAAESARGGGGGAVRNITRAYQSALAYSFARK